MISPILFLLDADWEMRKTTEDQQRGLIWGLTDRLEDNDFAGDIALLSHTQKDMRDKTETAKRQEVLDSISTLTRSRR